MTKIPDNENAHLREEKDRQKTNIEKDKERKIQKRQEQKRRQTDEAREEANFTARKKLQQAQHNQTIFLGETPEYDKKCTGGG